jgi:hypothetical protein
LLPYIRPVYGEDCPLLASMKYARIVLFDTTAFAGLRSRQVFNTPV